MKNALKMKYLNRVQIHSPKNNKELRQQKYNLIPVKLNQKKNRRKMHEINSALELQINK